MPPFAQSVCKCKSFYCFACCKILQTVYNMWAYYLPQGRVCKWYWVHNTYNDITSLFKAVLHQLTTQSSVNNHTIIYLIMYTRKLEFCTEVSLIMESIFSKSELLSLIHWSINFQVTLKPDMVFVIVDTCDSRYYSLCIWWADCPLQLAVWDYHLSFVLLHIVSVTYHTWW